MNKTMIFLFDGTANDASDTAVDSYSNVYRINQLIAESKITGSGETRSQKTQIVFYMPGVGTKFTVWRPRKTSFLRLDRVMQQIFGEGAEHLILRAYINLCSNYKGGDDIVLIGFSRGAAAARIFSRFVSDFGILTSGRLSLLDRLWNEFVRISEIESDEDYLREITDLKSDMESSEPDDDVFHPTDKVQIAFLGLFDTVIGALDSDLRRTLDFRDTYPASAVRSLVHLLSMHDVRKEYEFKRFTLKPNMPENFREIWVPGVHSDVGGGYQDDFIGNVALLTMAHFLKIFGGVGLENKACERVKQKIRTAVKNGGITINQEPFVANRESRYAQISAYDEIHPLHQFLVGKKLRWKGTNLVEYVNRHEMNTADVDGKIKKEFEGWLE